MAKTPLRALLAMLAVRVAADPRPVVHPRSRRDQPGRGDARRRLRGRRVRAHARRHVPRDGLRGALPAVALRLGEPWRSRALALEARPPRRHRQRTARRDACSTRLEADQPPLLDDPSAPTPADRRRAPSSTSSSTTGSTPALALTGPRRSRATAPTVGRAGVQIRHRQPCSAAGALYYMGEIGELDAPRPCDGRGRRRATATASPQSRCAARFRSRGSSVSIPRRSRPSSRTRFRRGRCPTAATSCSTCWRCARGSSSRSTAAIPSRWTAWIPDEVRRAHRALLDRAPIQGVLLRTTLVRHALACAAAAKPGSPRRKEALASARAEQRRLRKLALKLAPPVARIFDGVIADGTTRKPRSRSTAPRSWRSSRSTFTCLPPRYAIDSVASSVVTKVPSSAPTRVRLSRDKAFAIRTRCSRCCCPARASASC